MRPNITLKRNDSGSGVIKAEKHSTRVLNGKTVSEAVSKSMRSNRSIGTLPEKTLARILWNAGFRGYRKNDRRITGRPDLYFPRLRLAVMLNGCFWHRCPYCKLSLPKSNSDFWEQKFEANKRRDVKQAKARLSEGIRTLVVWECILKKDPESVLTRFRKAFEKQLERNG